MITHKRHDETVFTACGWQSQLCDSTYAKAAMAEPEVRAKYEKAAAKQNKRPIDLAVSDYLKGQEPVSFQVI